MNVFELMATLAFNGSAYKKGLEDAKAQGSEFGSTIKTTLGNAAKAVGTASVAAVAAGATALVSLTKSAVSAYADYEQLIGGVETLFGDASDQVAQNAANAYKTAGLSMNEYMETVTSFAASLKQSVATESEAATVADIAIQDMADNANKMGTSMSSIQNAYQGFAKQNYTMLDNLKLGYGGTKEEMERLLEDAEKLSGVEYNIDSLADVYEAIHVVQTELGITGTTALEASETISGSIAMTSSAWTNFVAGLGNPSADVKELAENVISSASNVVKNVTPIIKNVVEVIPVALQEIVNAINDNNLLKTVIDAVTDIIAGLIQSLPALLSQVMSAAVSALETILPELSNALPTLINTVLDLVTMLVSNLDTILGPILESLPQIITSIITGLANHIPEIVTGIVDLVIMILEHLPEIIQAILDAIPLVIEKIVEAIFNNLPRLIVAVIKAIIETTAQSWAYLIQFAGQIVEWFSIVINNAGEFFASIKDNAGEFFAGIWSSIVSWLAEVFGEVAAFFVSAINKVMESWGTIKSNLAEGFSNIWSTLTTWFSKIINKVGELVREIPNKLKEGLASIRQVGTNLVQGLWNGINDAVGWVLGKIQGFGEAILSGIKSIFGIHSPSTLFRDEVGKYLAQGVGVGFEDEMDDIAQDMADAIPTSFDTELNATSNVNAGYGTSLNSKIDAILEVVSRGMVIVLDSGTLVGEIAPQMNVALGDVSNMVARGVA